VGGRPPSSVRLQIRDRAARGAFTLRELMADLQLPAQSANNTVQAMLRAEELSVVGTQPAAWAKRPVKLYGLHTAAAAAPCGIQMLAEWPARR
jgi:hypothetical protein